MIRGASEIWKSRGVEANMGDGITLKPFCSKISLFPYFFQKKMFTHDRIEARNLSKFAITQNEFIASCQSDPVAITLPNMGSTILLEQIFVLKFRSARKNNSKNPAFFRTEKGVG